MHVANLLIDDVFVAWKIVPGAQNAYRSREAFAVLHVREEEGVGRARVMRVVDDEVAFGDAIAELDYFNVAIGFAADAFVAVFSED